MNCADSVPGIVLSGEQSFSLCLKDLVFQSFEQRPQLVKRGGVFFGKFKEHRGVGDFSRKLLVPLNGSLQPATLLQKFLRRFLV
jgi:hypothetical protein